VLYYNNTSASFQDEILRAGDVCPNPGPESSIHDKLAPVCNTPSINYSRDKLLDIGKSCIKIQLSPTVWSQIVELRLNSKPSTHRGIRGGKQKRMHFL